MHTSIYAQDLGYLNNIKNSVQSLIKPQDDQSYKTAQMQQLTNFQFKPDAELNELPVIESSIIGRKAPFNNLYTEGLAKSVNDPRNNRQFSIDNAVQIAVKRNPAIAESIATLASQNANIDVAKAGYYPQLQAGMNTGDFTASDKGRQVYSIQANQRLYDFGKVESSVNTQQNKLAVEQANVLGSIDEIAAQTARTILRVLRYQATVKIAQDQVTGVSRLYEIARLRANAGISSNADPVQAQSYVEYSKSYLISQQNFLSQEQQKLKTLLGFEVDRVHFTIPDELVSKSGLYDTPTMNTIPAMIAAQAEIEVAKSQKKQTELSRYPTISLVGSVNKALNGKNPNTGIENDSDSSISISMSSNFYQGGAVGSQVKAAGFAEQAARSKLNAIYLNILDSTRTARENIENMNKQISVLQDRESSTAKTRELYEEQYKLGKRSILDLLSSAQSFHSSRAERESARYDIYDTVAVYIHVTGKSRDVYHLNNTKIQGFEIQP
ncbi:TolC family protein [Acinetobacter silvestris]|nr:TolC family protein [Acinetobacter silvestris]